MSRHICVALLAAAFLACGCETMKKMTGQEKNVTTDQMTAPARATLDKVLAGGTVTQMTEEKERGREIYDVEATVNGQHKEWTIARDNGEVLGTEVPVEWNELPQPVQAAAEKHFGTTTGLKAMKGEEYGETTYEINGMKNGKMSEASFNPDGSPEK